VAPDVHSSALVDPKATLGKGVRVGAFSVVGPEVILGDGVEIGHHVVLEGRVEIGPRCRIGHGAVLGGEPQDLKFKPGTPSALRLGAETVIREYVTIHRSSRPEGWTEVGPRCLIMALSHIGHDCRLGEGVIVINSCAIGGHCEFDDHATLGGHGGFPPFTRVGTFAYVGGYSKLEQDLPPYMLANGIPATVRGINNVGLRRAGVSAADRRTVKEAYRLLYRSGLGPGSALERIRRELPGIPPIERLVAFVAGSSRHGICPPPAGWAAGTEAEDFESERIV
jgi:UDP-N-acetylglucosamine acyltransferase